MAKRVFITGASSGIGHAFARYYAARGATLGLVARRRDLLIELANCSPAAHEIFSADVADAVAMGRAAATFIAGGVPDIVIANAGISVGTLGSEAEDLAAVRRILEVNVLGIAHTLQPFVEPMRRSGRGHLVGVASVAGIRGLPGAGAYSASKAAAISLLESLRVELRGSGVKVTTLAPGYIATPMTERNPYRMPFILNADTAVARMARAIERGASYAVIPWQMGLVARHMRLLPDPLYDALFSRAGRKPRGLPP